MLKIKFSILLATLIFSFVALAQKPQAMGLLIKNKKTDEILGLRCEKSDQDKICLEFQFLLLEEVKKGQLQITAKLGEVLNYDQLTGVLDSIRVNVYHNYRNESFINDSGVGLSYSDFNDMHLDSHLTGLSTYLISGDNGWSTGGKIWRRIIGVVSLPVFLVVDGARYAAEALVAGGEITGKSVVYGTVGLAYDLPDSINANKNANKAEKALRQSNQAKYQGKIKKVKHRLFNLIKSKIINY